MSLLRRIRLRRLLGPLMVITVASAAFGAGVMALLSPFSSPGPLSVPALTGHGERDPLSAQRVYNRILPSVFDVTAALQYDDETAQGTAFVFDAARGLVLTNNHVIRDATSVTTTLASTGKRYAARVVGTDTRDDIAVLQVLRPPRLAQAPIGDSGSVQLGDRVLVIGNQAGQGDLPTIAPGIINSLNRTIAANDGGADFTETLRDMLQTSAQIEPGDSGGPLANSRGRVIGVDTAASTGAGTAGFAIPVDSALTDARRIAAGRGGPGITTGGGAFLGVVVAAGDHGTAAGPARLSSAPAPRRSAASRGADGPPARKAIAVPGRRHEPPGRGAGPTEPAGASCLASASEAVMPDRVAPVRYGALVEGVLCGSPAAGSALAPGDAIVRAAGRAIRSPGALASVLAGCAPGAELPVTWVELDGSSRSALIRVSVAPAP